MMLRHISRMYLVLVSSGGIFAILRWRPFSLSSFLITKKLKRYKFNFRTIIDGGANVGQFARSSLENFKKARVISFEPLPDVAEKLKTNLANSGNRFKLIPYALGKRAGIISFNRNSHTHSSSVLELHNNHRKAFPSAIHTEKLKLKLTTLDKALKRELLKKPVLLKLDLQGYELEALKGASKVLKRIDAVLIEVSLKPMYEGEPGFREIERYLKKRGFFLKEPLDYLKDSVGNFLQMDVLFLRK